MAQIPLGTRFIGISEEVDLKERGASAPFFIYLCVKSNQMKTLAVYGTLKGGYGNHYLLQDSEFVDYGKTVGKYRMCIPTGIPFVIRGEHIEGKHIDVEVYNVSDDDVLSVDMLEGHPTWYKRERVPISLSTGVIKMCWLYFADESYDDGVYYSNYGLKGR